MPPKEIKVSTAEPQVAQAQDQQPTEPLREMPATPVADFSLAPNWGEGGRFVINEKGERVAATEENQA